MMNNNVLNSAVVSVLVHILLLAWLANMHQQAHTKPEIAPILVRLLSPAALAQAAPSNVLEKPIAPRAQKTTEKTPKKEQVLPKTVKPVNTAQASNVLAQSTQPSQAELGATSENMASENVAQAEPARAQPSQNVGDQKQEAPVEPQIVPPSFGAAYLENPAPEYPRLSKRAGEEGRVVLKVLVTAEGRADEVQVEKSSHFEQLDNAAMDAVKRWRFIPAKKGNQPISAYVQVPIKFSLDS